MLCNLSGAWCGVWFVHFYLFFYPYVKPRHYILKNDSNTKFKFLFYVRKLCQLIEVWKIPNFNHWKIVLFSTKLVVLSTYSILNWLVSSWLTPVAEWSREDETSARLTNMGTEMKRERFFRSNLFHVWCKSVVARVTICSQNVCITSDLRH